MLKKAASAKGCRIRPDVFISKSTTNYFAKSSFVFSYSTLSQGKWLDLALLAIGHVAKLVKLAGSLLAKPNGLARVACVREVTFVNKITSKIWKPITYGERMYQLPFCKEAYNVTRALTERFLLSWHIR